MSTAPISSLFGELQPALLAGFVYNIAQHTRRQLVLVSEELVDDEHEFDSTMWNDVEITHVLSAELRPLCLVCRNWNQRVNFAAGTGPPTCCDLCHQSLLRMIHELVFVPNPRTSPGSSSVGSSSRALTDDYHMGGERTIAGPPGKRSKLAPLARLLRNGESFGLIGNHPNEDGDEFADSQSVLIQLPRILKHKAVGFDDAAVEQLRSRTLSFDVNATGDNTRPWLKYDAARLLLDLFEAPPIRALGCGGCIDAFEQLGFDWTLVFDSSRTDTPHDAAKHFVKNGTAVREEKERERGGRVGVENIYKTHMRPQTYAGDNLCRIEFYENLFSSEPSKRVPIAIMTHVNHSDGGLAVHLADNHAKLIASLGDDEIVANIPASKIYSVDLAKLRQFVKSAKPSKPPVSHKQKKKSEPKRRPK